MKLDTRRKTYSDESFHYSPPYKLSDFICGGSDLDETSEQIEQKHHRYEIEARRYLDGKLPTLQSTILKGPLSDDWINPWQQGTNRTEGDWWQPDSDRLFLTRKKLMKRAASYGLGYLTPDDALAWCKASAEEAVNVESTNGDITMTKVKSSCITEDKSSEKFSKNIPLPGKRKLENSFELRCNTSPNAGRYDHSQDDDCRASKRARRSQRLAPKTQCAKYNGRITSSPSLTLHPNKKRRPKTIASSQKVESFYNKSKPSGKSSQSLKSKKHQFLQEEFDTSDVSQVEKSNIASINFKRTKRKLNSAISIKKKKDRLESNLPQEESCFLGACSSSLVNIDQKNEPQCELETPAASIPMLKPPLLRDNYGENANDTCSRQDILPVTTTQIKKSTLPLSLKQQNFVDQHSFVTDYAPSSRDLDKFMFKKKVRAKRRKIGEKRSLTSQYTPSSNERQTSQPRKRIKTSHSNYHDSKASHRASKTNVFFIQKPPPNYESTTASIDSSPEFDSTSMVQITNEFRLNSIIHNDLNRSTQEKPELIDTPLTCSTKMNPEKSNGINSFVTNLSSETISRIQRRKKIKTRSFASDSIPSQIFSPLNLIQSCTSKEEASKRPLKDLGLTRSCSKPNLAEISVPSKDETIVCTNIASAGRNLISSQKQHSSLEYDSQPINPLLNAEAIKWFTNPNDRSNQKSPSSKNNSVTLKKDSFYPLSISKDNLSLSSPQKLTPSTLSKDFENFDNREEDLEINFRPEISATDDETSKISRMSGLYLTHQKPSTPTSLEAEKDASMFYRKKKSRTHSHAEQNSFSGQKLHETIPNNLDRKLSAQPENELGKESSLSCKSYLKIQPQSPWSAEVQPIIHDGSETPSKLQPLDNDFNKSNNISDYSRNTQDNEDLNENEKTIVEQNCVRHEGNSTQKNIETISFPNHTRNQTPRSDFQVDVQKLYQSALKNPWKSFDKISDSAKINKRVSFGLLDSTVKLKQPEQTIKLRRNSNNSPQSLRAGQQEIHHHTSMEIKSSKEVAAPLLSPNPCPSYGKYSVDESPGVGAMAEAFLAAEGKIETEKSPPAHYEAPSLPSSNKQKNYGLFSSHFEDEMIKPVEFGDPEDNLALDIGAIAEFDADAILGNLGDILEDWTVESELHNINRFATYNQQSTEAWSK